MRVASSRSASLVGAVLAAGVSLLIGASIAAAAEPSPDAAPSPVISATPSASQDGLSVMELDTDRPGLDIDVLDLSTADPASCDEACRQDPNCQAWTYVKPDTIQGPEARCWLKGVIPGAVPNPCCISGFKPFEMPAAGPEASPPMGGPRPAIGETADDGARIVQVDTIDARTRDLTIESPSVGTVQVRLLLPATFDAEPGTTWPVLLLLHGYGGNHADWTDLTDVEAFTAPTDLLVVMPDAANGWYADAWNGGAGGAPAWETFHTTELLQLIERNWGASDERVIAGLSMGGLGAMDYAARHPGMFKAAASYSGVLDTTGQELFDGEAAFGDPVAQAENWKSHNPLDLAPALEGLPLYVSYGDGQPGPLDPAGGSDTGTELWVAPQNAAFVDRLEELGIPATVDAYGPGSHDWPYWERALHESLPMLLEALEE